MTLMFVMLLLPAMAAAQEVRRATRDDWMDHVPLFIACVLFVIAVDALFIWKIVRDRRRGATPDT
jgi:uncharacterized membrane protein AbrB (regulator of aidB expression)